MQLPASEPEERGGYWGQGGRAETLNPERLCRLISTEKYSEDYSSMLEGLHT